MEEELLFIEFNVTTWLLKTNSGLNSYQLLQTITGDGNVNEEDRDGSFAGVDESAPSATAATLSGGKSPKSKRSSGATKKEDRTADWSTSSSSESSAAEELKFPLANGSHRDLKGVMDIGVTPALQRRRERAERQQQEADHRSVSPIDADPIYSPPRNIWKRIY